MKYILQFDFEHLKIRTIGGQIKTISVNLKFQWISCLGRRMHAELGTSHEHQWKKLSISVVAFGPSSQAL